MAKNIKACLTHETDEWKTPTSLYKYFIETLGCIDTFEYKSNVDEFKTERGRNIKLFCNPPFSKMKKIPEWIWHNYYDLGNSIYLLIPSRTDTVYFHKLLKMKPFIYFIKGRLHYNDSKAAPFPTMLLVFEHSWKYPIYAQLEQNEKGLILK